MITSLPPDTITNLTGLTLGIGVNLSLAQDATSVTITPDGGSGVIIPAATSTLAGVLDAARAAAIDGLPGSYNDLTDLPDRTAFFSVLFDGGGGAIVAPITRFVYVPFNATIIGWALMADQTGSITIDIWKEAIGGFPPTIANSITGGSPMLLSAAASAVVTGAPASWTPDILAGDCLAFNVSSSSTVQAVTAQILVTH
jgi:hypothetical protein